MAAALPLAAAASPMMGEVLGAATAASLFPAAAGAAGAGAAGAGLGAGLGGSSLMNGLYGMLPGMVPGSQQAAMLAGQTGAFGLPGLAATGNAAASAASGPLGQSIWSGLSKLTGPGSNQFMQGMRGLNAARSGLQMMQPQQQAQRSPPRVAPVQMGSPPQASAKMPTPAQLAAYRRVRGMQRQGREMA